MEGLSLLQDFCVILLVAGAAGWIFRRIGLSAVVGYLVAGVLVGPHTTSFALISDVRRVEALSDLGLVFLMFFVGLGLSLRRIKRMGGYLPLATILTALGVFNLAQIFAWAWGWDQTGGLVFAAMMMVSSSAIITRTLAERGLTHERYGLNAQGVTLLEDLIAVVMLTILGSRIQVAGDNAPGLAQTLLLLIGFVVLVLVFGLIAVPKILRKVGRAGDADLKSSIVAGLVCASGLVSLWAGFSAALGAFLFGVVVAGTPFKAQIEKRLGGAQDMFSAIFFVSIGMLIDVRMFAHHAWLILGVSAFALLARPLAAWAGFMASGAPIAMATSTALIVTPIGEFSYIIAQLGVSAKAVPESFYAVAVGASILTAICSPLLARHAGAIGETMERILPAGIRNAHERYRAWLVDVGDRAADNKLWKFSKRGVWTVFLELVMLGGLFGFSQPMLKGLEEIMDLAHVHHGWIWIYWSVVGLLAAALIAAILRNLHALSMLVASVLTSRSGGGSRQIRSVLQSALQLAGIAVVALLIYLTIPWPTRIPWVVFLLVGALCVFTIVLWRRLIYFQSRIEHSLAATVVPDDLTDRVRSAAGRFQRRWKVDVAEVVLSEQTACAGKSVKELDLRMKYGCSIIEIDRQGFVIGHPKPDERLFPGDRILLFGEEEQIRRARMELAVERPFRTRDSDFDESVLEAVDVAPGAYAADRQLVELQVYKKTGVQILGIDRENHRILSPSGSEVLRAGDRLLVLASHSELEIFTQWLQTGVAPGSSRGEM